MRGVSLDGGRRGEVVNNPRNKESVGSNSLKPSIIGNHIWVSDPRKNLHFFLCLAIYLAGK